MKQKGQWNPPPLDPRKFHDPYRRKANRSTRRTVSKGLKTLLKYCVKPNGQ